MVPLRKDRRHVRSIRTTILLTPPANAAKLRLMRHWGGTQNDVINRLLLDAGDMLSEHEFMREEQDRDEGKSGLSDQRA